MESNLSKIAITLALALFTASTQCIAACGILPCNGLPQRHQPVPAEDCHHKAPPADGHQEKSSCAHQVLVSEAGPQAPSFTLDTAALCVISIDMVERAPQSIVLLDPASDRSPPPPSDLSARTILRV